MPRDGRPRLLKLRPGWSLLGVVVGALLLVALVLWLNVSAQSRGREARDQVRRHDLAVAARAQEFYFDHHRRYGTWAELGADRLLTAPPRDPVSNQPYDLYFSTSADQWCTWAKLETAPAHYLIQSEGAATTTSELPRNLSSCQLP